MSEAMTNREIEDVLTSIRRLVAQEGGRGAESGKLLLTEAQRVGGAPVVLAAPMVASQEQDEDSGGDDDFAFDPADYDAGPFSAREGAIPAPDFGRLEATIAELEAAVSASGQGFEAEGDVPRASNVTELYGRVNFVHRSAENLTVKPEPALPLAAAEVPVAAVAAPAPADTRPDTPEDSSTATDAAAQTTEVTPPEIGTDPDNDEDVPDTIIDEAMLRQLIAQIVREELHGQLGERITQQVRKLVRAEIAKALDDRSFL